MAQLRTRQAPASYRIAIEHGTAYEALLGLSMFTGDETEDSYEMGRSWFTRARAAAPRPLTASVRKLVGGEGALWFNLLGMAHEAGGKHAVEDLRRYLRGLPAAEVPKALSGGRLPRGRAHERSAPTTRRMAALGAPVVKRLTIEVLDGWSQLMVKRLGGDAERLAADADGKQRAARRLSAPELIELATGGVVYEGEAGIDQVLLIPSIVTRPWVTIAEWDSIKIICYPAHSGGAAIRDDADRRLAAIYRALGDATRLRLLRELGGGDRRLTELAEAVGLAKSTIHEHLGALRTAGLIRVQLGADKRYGLRPAMPDLNRLLKDYLCQR